MPHRLLAALLLALAALPARPDEATDLAIRALRDDRSLKVRTQAAIALGQRRSPEAMAALATSLAVDPAAAVRVAAAAALGRVGDRGARAPLSDAAQADPDPAVREACRRALAALGRAGGRMVSIEEPSGTAGGAAARAALRGALERHLREAGFEVVASGGVRLKPSVVRIDVEGATVAVRAAVVAVEGDGRMAAMLEGAARLKSSRAISREHEAGFAARALEAAARTITEDLAARLGQR